MSSLERLILSILIEKGYSETNEHTLDTKIEPREFTRLYRNVMDKIALKMIDDSIDNDEIAQAIKRLTRLERIIIAFNIVQEMELKEIASILDTTSSNIYTYKSRALKRLKEKLRDIEDDG